MAIRMMAIRTTDPRYTAWIESHRDPNDKLRGLGKCRQFSEEMAKEFPELRVTAGYYWDFGPLAMRPGPNGHWWCVAPDESIVDPTAYQFGTNGEGDYEEVPEHERPVGKCMNCGDEVYRYGRGIGAAGAVYVYADETPYMSSSTCSKFCFDEMCEATL